MTQTPLTLECDHFLCSSNKLHTDLLIISLYLNVLRPHLQPPLFSFLTLFLLLLSALISSPYKTETSPTKIIICTTSLNGVYTSILFIIICLSHTSAEPTSLLEPGVWFPSGKAMLVSQSLSCLPQTTSFVLLSLSSVLCCHLFCLNSFHHFPNLSFMSLSFNL